MRPAPLTHPVFWRRLDQEGHDACRFTETTDGWTIEGAAIFQDGGTAANLAYRLICDHRWTSLEATVSGWIGKRNVDVHIEREGDDEWRINGTINPDLNGLKDIDLGFTPASNTNAIRRLNLSEGDEGKSVAVWLDTEDWAIKPLPQTYRRIRKDGFDYASPQHNYEATLVVDGFGAVTEYPQLWVMVRQGQA